MQHFTLVHIALDGERWRAVIAYASIITPQRPMTGVKWWDEIMTLCDLPVHLIRRLVTFFFEAIGSWGLHKSTENLVNWRLQLANKFSAITQISTTILKSNFSTRLHCVLQMVVTILTISYSNLISTKHTSDVKLYIKVLNNIYHTFFVTHRYKHDKLKRGTGLQSVHRLLCCLSPENDVHLSEWFWCRA